MCPASMCSLITFYGGRAGGIAPVSWARQLQDEESGVNPALSAAVWWSWHSNASRAEPGRWHGAARVSSGWPKTRV